MILLNLQQPNQLHDIMNNPPYSNLYNGYFDVRDPYTKNLDEIYEKPVPIPAYSPDEIFTDHALDDHHAILALSKELEQLKQTETTDVNLIYSLERKLRGLITAAENRDQDIFRYFHFVAARNFQLETLKAGYRAYRMVKEAWQRQSRIYEEFSEAVKSSWAGKPLTMIVNTFKTELEYIFEHDCYGPELSDQVKAKLNAYSSDLYAAMGTFYQVAESAHARYKRRLLDFQSNLEEERKLAILNAY